VLKLVLELISGLARTESSVNSSKDESEEESVDLRLHHLSEVEDTNGNKSNTSIDSKGDIAVKLKLLGSDHSSNTQDNNKDVNEKELAGLTHKDRAEENGKDQNNHIVKNVRAQVDTKTIKQLSSVLRQPILGVEVVLLHLIEIHDDSKSSLLQKSNDTHKQKHTHKRKNGGF